MNHLISITTNENDEQLVSGRELHKFLGIETKYEDWFPRMTEYGFTESIDYHALKIENVVNNRTYYKTDHAMKLDMAKEVSMIQRNEKGKQARQYFLEVEKAWNSPDMIMKRALQIADKRVITLQTENNQLQLESSVQKQQIAELQPKASYYDLVLQNKSLLSDSKIAKDFGRSAVWLNRYLHELGVQYKQGDIWLLYAKHQDKGYTQTHTHVIDSEKSRVTTKWTQKGRLFIYDLLKNKGILPLIERQEVGNSHKSALA